MPLWKLQTVSGGDDDFLYANCRGENVTEIELRPGVAFTLRQFHGLLQELVRSAWVRFRAGSSATGPFSVTARICTSSCSARNAPRWSRTNRFSVMCRTGGAFTALVLSLLARNTSTTSFRGRATLSTWHTTLSSRIRRAMTPSPISSRRSIISSGGHGEMQRLAKNSRSASTAGTCSTTSRHHVQSHAGPTSSPNRVNPSMAFAPGDRDHTGRVVEERSRVDPKAEERPRSCRPYRPFARPRCVLGTRCSAVDRHRDSG